MNSTLNDVSKYKLRIYPPDKDAVSNHIHRGIYENFESKIVSTFIRPGDRVINVGAHIGFHAVRMADLVGPEGEVICFEPAPSNVNLLRENIETNGFSNRCNIHPVALGDKKSQEQFFFNGPNSGDFRPWIGEQGMKSCLISVEVFDEFVKDPWRVDFVMIDAQGYEVKILRGMKRLLSIPKLTMLIEYWPYGLSRVGDTVRDFVELIKYFTVFHVDSLRKSLWIVRDLEELIEPGSDAFVNLLLVK
jgi:FkbM family methyltransferase